MGGRHMLLTIDVGNTNITMGVGVVAITCVQAQAQ